MRFGSLSRLFFFYFLGGGGDVMMLDFLVASQASEGTSCTLTLRHTSCLVLIQNTTSNMCYIEFGDMGVMKQRQETLLLSMGAKSGSVRQM